MKKRVVCISIVVVGLAAGVLFVLGPDEAAVEHPCISEDDPRWVKLNEVIEAAEKKAANTHDG